MKMFLKVKIDDCEDEFIAELLEGKETVAISIPATLEPETILVGNKIYKIDSMKKEADRLICQLSRQRDI